MCANMKVSDLFVWLYGYIKLVHLVNFHVQTCCMQRVSVPFCSYTDCCSCPDFKTHQLPLARIKKIMKSDEDVKVFITVFPMKIFVHWTGFCKSHVTESFVSYRSVSSPTLMLHSRAPHTLSLAHQADAMVVRINENASLCSICQFNERICTKYFRRERASSC